MTRGTPAPLTPIVAIHSKPSGFSLLELLVVLFIIGILVTMFTLSVGVTGGDREVDNEIDRLQALLKLAGEEAIMEGRELGLRFYEHGYEFSNYYEDFDNPDESEWVVLTQDELLRPRDVSESLVLTLEIEGRDVVLDASADDDQSKRTNADDPDDDDENDDYRPQIFIFSSGDISPFTFQLRRAFQNTGISMEVAGDGTVEFTEGPM